MNYKLDVDQGCPDIRIEVWNGYVNLRFEVHEGACAVCTREGGTSMDAEEMRELRRLLKKAIKDLESE